VAANVGRWEPETRINSLQTAVSARRLGVNGGEEGPRRVTGHPEATPGRRGRLPARTPLRTVRESFPSYGSSPHKDGHFLSCPAVQPLANRGRAAWQYRPAATLHCAPLRQQLQDAPTDWRRSPFAFLG